MRDLLTGKTVMKVCMNTKPVKLAQNRLEFDILEDDRGVIDLELKEKCRNPNVLLEKYFTYNCRNHFFFSINRLIF